MYIRRRRTSIFSQGYRYALRDQDTFCLAVRQPAVKNYRGRKYVQWNGGYKYGLKGAQPSWCVVSSIGRVVVYCEAKKKKGKR
jgi:hypothetical protein